MTEANESKIHTHAVDPEGPLARHYVVTLVTSSGQLAQIAGMDKAAPRDIARRVADMTKRFVGLIRENGAAPFWHEALLEGDEDGYGYLVVTDPRMVLSVATPVEDPDEDEDEDEDEDGLLEYEEKEEAPAGPKPFRLPSKVK